MKWIFLFASLSLFIEPVCWLLQLRDGFLQLVSPEGLIVTYTYTHCDVCLINFSINWLVFSLTM